MKVLILKQSEEIFSILRNLAWESNKHLFDILDEKTFDVVEEYDEDYAKVIKYKEEVKR